LNPLQSLKQSPVYEIMSAIGLDENKYAASKRQIRVKLLGAKNEPPKVSDAAD